VHVQGLVGTIDGYSSARVIVYLVIGVAFGYLGFRVSEGYKRANGVTPWRWPSLLWAVIFLFSLLLGVVLYLIARSTTRPKAGPNDWPGTPQGSGPAPPWSGGGPGPQDFGAGGPPPGVWNVPPPPEATFPVFGQQGPPAVPNIPPGAPAQPPPPPPPPRSWLPDPSGRHELRYWDGARFTEHVADAGKISVDPI